MTAAELERKVFLSLSDAGLSPGVTVAVAFSGGPDSVALLNAVNSLGFDCIALHCNFHLRGDESNRDEKFCREFCKEKGIVLRTVSFDTYAEKHTGESIEMVCRRLRYDWFAKMQAETCAEYLLTGHHRDDNTETFFLNIFRGTGLRGITGIKPNGPRRCSPMLGLTREDILNYLSYNNLGYVTDSTNRESEYRRNRIRNKLLPLVREEFPDAEKGIAVTLRNLSDAYTLFSEFLAEKRRKYVREGSVDLRGIIRDEAHPGILLFYLLEEYGFNRTQTDDITVAAENNGAEFITSGWRGVVSDGFLELCRKEDDSEPLPFVLNMELMAVEALKEFDKTHRTLYLDADKVGDNPDIKIRKWSDGDRIAPFGMKGKTRLVSDIFSDAGISVIKKGQIPVITLGNDILWVYGLKESCLYPIAGNTKRVMKITLIHRNPDKEDLPIK